MLRNSISKRKLMMEFQLLFKRGKLAGKAFSNFIAFHNHGGASSPTATDHSIEFSGGNTPFYTTAKKKKRRRRQVENESFDASMITKALEIFSAEASDLESVISSVMPSPSPSPGALWWFGNSPALVRPLRVTDSPFMMNEEDLEGGKVDKEAEDFIKWFHEQLRRQQLESARATPDNNQNRTRLPTIVGRASSLGGGRN